MSATQHRQPSDRKLLRPATSIRSHKVRTNRHRCDKPTCRKARPPCDDLGVPVLNGTCTTCHDTPHGGSHSIPAPLDIGLTGDHPEALARTPDLPLYTFRQSSDGAIFKTTDPGRGLITGKFRDLGRFKGPVLRGLAARPPYFHNGSAATLEAAVTFYDKRFAIGLTPAEKSDLVAFLQTL